ncbi:hypothetical protein MBLNU457_1300t1 [Dothideomycetes sp. NU457]
MAADAETGFQKMDAQIPKASTVSSAAKSSSVPSDEPTLPPLSAGDYRIYNRMAEHMDLFHNNFRQTWNILYSAASANKRPAGMSLRQLLNMGDEFCHHLTIHHTIEERHIFPVLAKKMPAFKKELELLEQHKQIHEGLEVFEDWLRNVKSGEKDARMDEMKRILDSFGTVLWQHLDDEVKELGAENMRKYWTKQEMPLLPM